MFEKLDLLDRHITLAINSVNCPASDAFWLFMSNRVVWYALYIAFLALMFWRLGWKKALVMTAYIILCIVCVDQFANLIKDWACRLRPSHDPKMIEQGIRVLEGISENHCYGFYSAHAGNAFAFAVASIIAIKEDKRLKWRGYSIPIIIWALLLSLSRIFVGKHYFGDVVVGIIVGVAVALLLGIIAKKITARL